MNEGFGLIGFRALKTFHAASAATVTAFSAYLMVCAFVPDSPDSNTLDIAVKNARQYSVMLQGKVRSDDAQAISANCAGKGSGGRYPILNGETPFSKYPKSVQQI